MKRWARWEDWADVVLGAWLFFSPWIVGYGGGAGVNAFIVGALVVVFGLWSLGRPAAHAPGRLEVAIGIWLIIAPWALQFAGVASAAAWNAWIVGAALMLIASLGLERVSDTEPKRA